MGTNPTKAADNVYCKARKAAAKYNDKLNSREGAAEMLGLSSSAVADYELNITKVVPVDKVVLMADLYGAPELMNHYCATQCPIGCRTVATLEIAQLERLALKVFSALHKAKGIEEDLVDIAADGVISPDERPKLKEIMEALDRISQSAQEMKLWAEKNLEEE